MVLEPEHKKLERLVELIHKLLEPSDATIIWNDRVPDPDNPGQRRQIDVTIRREEYLTLVECRAHKASQDVTWIEELIGRRTSLSADAVIAVSLSGFTEGARRKAEAKGIILREFAELTELEISQWGETSEFSIVNYEFLDVRLTVNLPQSASETRPISDVNGRPIQLHAALKQIAEKYRPAQAGAFMTFKTQLHGIRAGDTVPTESRFEGRLRSVTSTFRGPVVRAYSNPIDKSVDARVEHFPLGTNQVIKGPELATLVFDLSQIEIPDNCIFGFPMFHQPGGLRVRSAVVVGVDNILRSNIPIRVEVRSLRA